MLLSAMYEYALDRKVLGFLDEFKARGKRDGAKTSPRLTAQLLLAVALGNLRISTGRRISMVSQWDAETHQRRLSIGDILKDNTWSRVMAMVDEDESDTAWLGGKVRLSTKLRAIIDSHARSVHFLKSMIYGHILILVATDLEQPLGGRPSSSSVPLYTPC
jgi:hypothetical protein